MRWSWPAFASGAAVSAFVCLLLTSDRQERVRDEPSEGVVVALRPKVEPRAERMTRAEPAKPPIESPGSVPVDVPVAEETAAPRSDRPVATEVPLSAAVTLSRSIDLDGTVRVQFTGEAEAPRAVVPLLLTFDGFAGSKSAASQSLARGQRAADDLLGQGRSPSDADVEALLGSGDDGDREAAIGLLSRSKPPGTARLLKLARDASVGGSLRSTAMIAAVQVAPLDREVASTVVALVQDRDAEVRTTAIELLPQLGSAGADRVVALLRAGDYPQELLPQLVASIAASERALDFLLSRPDPAVAFAVLEALSQVQPADPEARSRLLAHLPSVLAPLVGSPEMLLHAGGIFATAAAAGHDVFLRSIATSPTLPTALRLAAVDAALGADACASGRAALLAATLSDRGSPVELLRAVVNRVPDGVEDGAVRAALAALSEAHPSEWLREEARAKLGLAPGAPAAGELRIVSGVYGKDGHTVDVTDALASMVVGGRLVVEAGNALAGDPLVGVVKDLAVVYEWKGERRTRRIAEYERLVLP